MGRKKPKRELNKLEPVTLKKLGPGFHSDGAGLYFVVGESGGSRSWILRTIVRGKRTDIGLGALSTRSLAEARVEAAKLRARARQGEDVLAKRRLERRKSTAPTFEIAARAVHKEVAPTLRNEHNKTVWIRSMENHVFPVFGKKTVDQVDASDVLRAIAPIWTKKTDMARKVLSRIRRVFNSVTIAGYRSVQAGDLIIPLPNPTAGVLDALPKQPKAGHHASLPYAQVPAFILKVRSGTSGIAVKLGMEFTILTVARTANVIEAKWNEIDLKSAIWSIPGDQMKMEEPHQVPLSDRCLEILDEAKRITDGGSIVFCSGKRNEPLSNMAMLSSLQDMEGYEEFTMHGFRATFKTWAHDRTNFDHLVIEASLAHAVRGIERHYLRTTFLEQRRKLMQQWAQFCTATPAQVVAMR